MLTIERIKKDFSFIAAMTGNTETYAGTDSFSGHGEFCDIYFKSVNKGITQKQVDTYNDFKRDFDQYIAEIERHISNGLSSSELGKLDEIKNSKLSFDVIEISQDNPKYDLVLVCGKTIKRFLLFKTNIDLRVEFKNGKIRSAKRSKNTMEDND